MSLEGIRFFWRLNVENDGYANAVCMKAGSIIWLYIRVLSYFPGFILYFYIIVAKMCIKWRLCLSTWK